MDNRNEDKIIKIEVSENKSKTSPFEVRSFVYTTLEKSGIIIDPEILD